MWKDPIVEEVRKHRREIEKECDSDFEKIFKRIKEREKSLKNRLIKDPTKQSGTKKRKQQALVNPTDKSSVLSD